MDQIQGSVVSLFKHCIFGAVFSSFKKQVLKPLTKKLLIAGTVLLIAVTAVIWYVFTLKFDDTSKTKADFVIDSKELIREFEKDNKLANQKYTEKILEVKGVVTAVEKADSSVNIKMADSTTGSYAIFAFQDQSMADAKQVKAGESIVIRGSCSGGVYSEILETNFISFKRCAIIK